MADSKTPTPKASDPVKKQDADVVQREDGGGTRQREPKPEDYPPSAKVTPPLEQVNTTASQAVGSAAGADTTGVAEPLQDGIDAHAENQDKAVKTAETVAKARADLDKALASSK